MPFLKDITTSFGIAAGAMVISMLVYIIFNKYLPTKERKPKVKDANGNTSN